MSDEKFEPKIVGFLCNWCSYRAADLAGTARITYAPNVRIIRVMCSGRVDPDLRAQSPLAGRRRRDDRRLPSRRMPLHRAELQGHAPLHHAASTRCKPMGVEDERVQLVWASAAEGQQLAEADRQAGRPTSSELGPLDWSENWDENGERLEALEDIVNEHEEAMEVPQ